MNCGNQVAEKGRKKKKRKKKRRRIVTTKLLKMKGKKKDATSTTFLHHFHDKLQVVSCYWLKFESNTKITFLPQ